METIGMYSIVDNKSKRHDTPFFCINDIMAQRKFVMTSRDNQSVFGSFRDDFHLVKLGEFNVTTGEYTNINESILHGNQIEAFADNSVE